MNRRQLIGGMAGGVAALLVRGRAVDGDDGWVSVTDRLPEPHGAVLVWVQVTPGCGFSVVAHVNLWDKDNPRWFGNFSGVYELGGVTHWRPLPEPPREVF